MKKSFSKHLSSFWYVYVAWALFAVMFTNWLIGMLTKPKPEEYVTVFIGSYSTSSPLYQKLNEEKSDYLKFVEVECYSINDTETYYTMWQVYGASADIVILPESQLEDVALSAYYIPLSSSLLTEWGVTQTYSYDKDGKPYGIKVFDKTEKTGVCSEYIEYTMKDKEVENYYLLINKDSVHLTGIKETIYERDAVKCIISLMLSIK